MLGSSICILMVYLDRPLIEWLSQHQPDWLYHGFGHVTQWGEASRWFVILGSLLLLSQCAIWLKIPQKIADSTPKIFKPLKNLKAGLLPLRNASLLSLISLLTSGLLVNALKILAGRHRPLHWLRDGVYGFEPLQGLMHNVNSFPSGHSQVAGCVTTSLCLLFPRFCGLWITLGSLIVISRVIELDHYPSDVVAGSALGVAMTLWIYRLASQRQGRSSNIGKS
ncbi:MAG: phosphatase PAP2 family protein [Vampirovibrionales bacterium]|nr:phosphatase PAP2 family protein [Vampirovibrionales bacterium]